MDLVKTRLDYSPELIFVVDVSGTTELITEVRLSIISDLKKIGYVGRYVDGKAIFKLNDLQKYFDIGVLKYDLEVFIGNQYFVPISGQIEFTEPVRVTAEKEVITTPPVTFQAGLVMAKSLEESQKKEKIKILMKRLSEVSNDLGFPISECPTEEELEKLSNEVVKKSKPVQKIGHYIKL